MSNKTMPRWGEILHIKGVRCVIIDTSMLFDRKVKASDATGRVFTIEVSGIDEYKPRTVTVEYDLSPVEHELAIREKLINMGWTPPKE